LGPCDLKSVLSQLAPAVDPRLLVGSETLDDAAALRVSDDLAILFTADFITPLVDDPRVWGHIAAANALSDIYAMGGRPLAALNLVCWPRDLPAELLGEVLAGGAAAAAEADCLIAGGHTVEDREPKYGMAVIGLTRPDAIVRNRGSKDGDLLYLTKPLGTGILATAIKAELADADQVAAAVSSMTALNRVAAEAALAAGVHAMTDVTGFGLAGHLSEMLGDDGQLGAELSLAGLPCLPGVLEHMAIGMIPGGAYRNREAYGDRVVFAPGLEEQAEMLMFDPQTSGGLLVAVSSTSAATFEQRADAGGTRVWRLGRINTSGHIQITA
jgi:selenide, water dikinase